MAHYHVWHHPALNGKPAFATTDLDVPVNGDPKKRETRTFHSLKNDLAKLRDDGAAKGIVDASVVDVGKSSEGLQLWALKLGNGPDHKVLFTGCHHAREWISVEVPFLVAKYLIENYEAAPTTPKGKRIKHLVDNRQIWFVPMVNPDGHQFTVEKDRMWRSNRKRYVLKDETLMAPQLDGSKPRKIVIKAGEYTGVDINRNYPTADWGKETTATSRDPLDSARGVWAGPSSGSEAETTAIVKLIQAEKFRASITYHNFSQLLLYPSAARKDAYVQFVGKGMSKLIDEHGNPYTYQASDELYPTTGTAAAFSYEACPGRPSYTPELRPDHAAPKQHFFSGLPEAEIEPTFAENLGAALALINSAGFDAPAAKVKIACTPASNVVQVVRSCWKVFEGWKP